MNLSAGMSSLPDYHGPETGTGSSSSAHDTTPVSIFRESLPGQILKKELTRGLMSFPGQWSFKNYPDDPKNTKISIRSLR